MFPVHHIHITLMALRYYMTYMSQLAPQDCLWLAVNFLEVVYTSSSDIVDWVVKPHVHKQRQAKLLCIYTLIPLSRYSDLLRAGRSGDRFPVRARYSAPAQTGPGDHPASFPGGKAAGMWRWPPTPSRAEVKERVKLHLYSPFRTSWLVISSTPRFTPH